MKPRPLPGMPKPPRAIGRAFPFKRVCLHCWLTVSFNVQPPDRCPHCGGRLVTPGKATKHRPDGSYQPRLF